MTLKDYLTPERLKHLTTLNERLIEIARAGGYYVNGQIRTMADGAPPLSEEDALAFYNAIRDYAINLGSISVDEEEHDE